MGERKFANVQTELPGPKAKEWLKRRLNIVPDAVSYGVPTFVQSAKGAILHDVDGNTFIDFAGAIGTINIGHCHDSVVEALHDQIDRYIHTGFNVMMYDPYIQLAEKMAAISPGNCEKKEKCGKDRPQIHEKKRRCFLHWRFSWSHLNGDVFDWKSKALQARVWSVCTRDLSGTLPIRVPPPRKYE